MTCSFFTSAQIEEYQELCPVAQKWLKKWVDECEANNFRPLAFQVERRFRQAREKDALTKPIERPPWRWLAPTRTVPPPPPPPTKRPRVLAPRPTRRFRQAGEMSLGLPRSFVNDDFWPHTPFWLMEEYGDSFDDLSEYNGLPGMQPRNPTRVMAVVSARTRLVQRAAKRHPWRNDPGESRP